MQERARKIKLGAQGEILKHPGWEYLRHRALGAPDQEGCLLEDLLVEQDRCLRSNDLSGARYHQGRMDMAKKLFKGELVAEWLEELR